MLDTSHKGSKHLLVFFQVKHTKKMRANLDVFFYCVLKGLASFLFFRQLRWKASKPPGAWRTCFNTQFQSCWTARQLDLSWGRYLHGILGMGVYIRIKMYTLGEYICNICTIRIFIYTFNELSNRYMYISYNE